MANGSFLDYFTNSLLSQFKRPELGGNYSPDSAFGANMTHRSNLMNPNPTRDSQNAVIGATANPSQNAFNSLFQGIPGAVGSSTLQAGMPMLGRLLGGNIGGDVASAGTNVGLAAAQGFTNPQADVSAGMGLVNLLRRLF